MVKLNTKIPCLLQKRGVHAQTTPVKKTPIPIVSNNNTRSLHEQKKNEVKSTAYLLRTM